MAEKINRESPEESESKIIKLILVLKTG